jgi:hypothetical protein
MEKRISYCWTVFLFIVFITFGNGQDSDKLMFRTDNNNKLILGADNYFSILGMQEHPISEDQISAFLCTSYQFLNKKEPIPIQITKEGGQFKIHPDSLGWVEFRVEINEEIEKITIGIEPLKAICRVAGKVNGILSMDQFTAQNGVIAYLDLDGYNARCNITKFELIRIGADGSALRVDNKGGRFEEEAQRVIKKAVVGDLYIFRNIHYYCPQTAEQKAAAIFIEIE